MEIDRYRLLALTSALAEVGRSFYQRGWVLGTGGNFSAVLTGDPLELAITASGLHKGDLDENSFLVVDQAGSVLQGAGKPSAETSIHLAIAQSGRAGSVLHTHSVWSTLLSEAFVKQGGFFIEGYEMLKGLAGVATHQHREWIPILANTQSYAPLAAELSNLWNTNPAIHGFLLSGHGLYTWGSDIQEARRHVEIFEFLFEVYGRRELPAMERSKQWQS